MAQALAGSLSHPGGHPYDSTLYWPRYKVGKKNIQNNTREIQILLVAGGRSEKV